MPAPEHHRTPLRRISQGSLSALARSSSKVNGQTKLEFLAPALADLADEMAATHANIENLNKLGDALETFNESFASFLYAMKMNAFCVEWEQAPGDTSFVMAAKAAQEAQVALASLALQPVPKDQEDATHSPADLTYATTERTIVETKHVSRVAATSTASGSSIPKPGNKIKMTAKEKKQQDLKIDRIIQLLPIEFRGSDLDLRKAMEGVVARLIESEGGLRINEIVKANLPQAKVNKCLIALVNRKVVEKVANKGGALYHYRGMPDR
ncbi:hypothetical protein FRC03_006747 [Tulasnella sp. 419]|nr:hypothetical protein FRC02_000029 [Tulasnella sp. 418]KAG8968626.1 hypothetical protein FRC03_006747 [Tulasnella sp. 419]